MKLRVFVGWRGVHRFLGRSRDGQIEGVEEREALWFPLAEAYALARRFDGKAVP